MKLRSLFLFGAGIAVGVTVMRKLTEDDPDVAHGPQRQSGGNPALRVLSRTDRAALGQGDGAQPGCDPQGAWRDHANVWPTRATTTLRGASDYHCGA